MKYFTLALLDVLGISLTFIFCQFCLFGTVQINWIDTVLASTVGFLSLRHLQVYSDIVSSANLVSMLYRITAGTVLANLILSHSVGNGIAVFISAAPLSSMLLIFYRTLGNNRFKNSKIASKKIAVYGAGTAGTMLVAALSKSKIYEVSFFIDDDQRAIGRSLQQIPIVSIDDVQSNILKFGVNEIAIAIPSLSPERKSQIIKDLSRYPIGITTVPPLEDIVLGKKAVQSFSAFTMDDLLGRAAVAPDNDLLGKVVDEEVILVTGSGGSIGGELCLQLAKLKPKKIVLLDISEYGLYQIERKLLNYLNPCEITLQLGNVCDATLLEVLQREHRISVIFHAAAYKHVPLVEKNIIQAVQNNIFGTLNLIQFAEKYHIKRFVLISTDKAVRPTNVMGATKRFCELILQARADFNGANGKTTYSMVRFGNVLGSSGSVVPLFHEQIQSGGPLTLTSREITRYFMSISEAAELVIQSASLANNGDLFVLDMGKPIKIFDLALSMIRLAGKTVRDRNNLLGDIDIEITGLRPGEKLYEELLIGSNVTSTSHHKIMRAKEAFIKWKDIEIVLKDLSDALGENDEANILKILSDNIEGFVRANNELV